MNRSSMHLGPALAGAALLAFLAVALGACGPKPAATPPSPAAGSKADPKAEAKAGAGEGGAEEGAGTCVQIDIGAHEFLGDMDLDRAEGTVVIAVLDHATGNPHVHAAAPAVLNLVLEGGSKQLEMKAAPREGEPEGKTSTYRVQDPALKGLKALKGRVNLTIDGKLYVCDLASAH